MASSIDDRVIELYATLFESIFAAPFRAEITEKRRSRAVTRHVEEAADASSQSLTRFLESEKLSALKATKVLDQLRPLGRLLTLEDLSSTYTNSEDLAIRLGEKLAFRAAGREKRLEAIFREALHLVVQTLLLVGPVMKEWQRLGFSPEFPMLRRVSDRLDQISELIKLFGRTGSSAADQRFELGYRDYLLQRFFRIDVGTVQATTNLAVDLRELFVMPRVLPRAGNGETLRPGSEAPSLDIREARSQWSRKIEEPVEDMGRSSAAVPALKQVLGPLRNVLIGAPGSGKSTFLEWLQLQVASADVELVSGSQQAIPLLLRVRQLDIGKLPTGAALIAKATASPDRARIMPRGWIDRQMRAGRVFFMIDGLDEIDPSLREQQLIPWVRQLCESYPDCRFLISSRPLGYASSSLEGLGFHESELQDFDDQRITEFTRHWCTAVRLARNEPLDEARREGGNDGDRIALGFKENPYVRELAQPAHALGGLPGRLLRGRTATSGSVLRARKSINVTNEVRVQLYHQAQYNQCVTIIDLRALALQALCRGIVASLGPETGHPLGIRARREAALCREVALAMQVDDRAEYEAEKVKMIFQQLFPTSGRADQLFEHILAAHRSARRAPSRDLRVCPPDFPGIPCGSRGAGRQSSIILSAMNLPSTSAFLFVTAIIVGMR